MKVSLAVIECGGSLASERSERDTIRDVQIRAGAVYIYIYICMEIRMPKYKRIPRTRNEGGVSPLPFFIRASSFKRSNH